MRGLANLQWWGFWVGGLFVVGFFGMAIFVIILKKHLSGAMIYVHDVYLVSSFIPFFNLGNFG